MNTSTTTAPDEARLWAFERASANIRALRDDLNNAFIERREEIQCALTALVAGQHLLLLGPPGTAKSALANSLCAALGGEFFQLLFTKHSVPEEVFGPISLKGLEQDRYARVTGGYLPEAHVAFLDEIFKANSAILNALLTAINEREFDNGGQRTAIPLEMVIGASNELPQDESLGALYDRFILRRWVGYIKNRDSLRELLVDSSEPAISATLDRNDLAVMRDVAASVDVSDVVDKILAVRDALAREHGIIASDRRWRRIVDIVRAHAAIEGRVVANDDDLLVIVDALWDEPEQRAPVYGVVAKLAQPDLEKAMRLHDAALQQFRSIDLNDTSNSNWIRRVSQVNSELKRIVKQCRDLSSSVRVDEVTAKISKMHNAVARATLKHLQVE